MGTLSRSIIALSVIALVSIGVVISLSSTERAVADNRISVPLKNVDGALVVPVLINGAISLNFVIDSGATNVAIPADVVAALERTGTLQESDFLGKVIYQLADGSTLPSVKFRIRSLTVGGKVIENVTGSVNPVATDALLGQSFLTRFKSWSIDNARQALQLEPQDMQPAQPASTAATFYQARYFLTGYLLRAAVVCEGDGKRTVDAGFGLLDVRFLETDCLHWILRDGTVL